MNVKDFTLDSIALDKSRVFRDAVHNYISVKHQVILDLIDTAQMQRLRRIRQLGGTYQVYQSAEHSRFCHALGVYQISKMMCNENCIGSYISDYDKLTVMCAALLHDVGHGPFSHCFEDVFGLNHEEYTVKIIEGNSEVNTVLENFHTGFSKVVSSIIKKDHPNKILVQMVSSQLDSDRMDYLLRDSYFTGTTYGQFDLQRILRIMTVKDGQIVYRSSGVQAIEDYILARYHMYWQVYYHPTARAYEQLLICIFKRVSDLYHQGFDFGDICFLEPFISGRVNEQQYTDLDEGVVFYYFKKFSMSTDPILQDLTKRFLNRNLFGYQDVESKKQVDNIIKEYEALGFDTKYYVVQDDQSQIPYRYYGNKSDIHEINITTKNGLVALPAISEIVGAITNSKKSKKDIKIFFPKQSR